MRIARSVAAVLLVVAAAAATGRADAQQELCRLKIHSRTQQVSGPAGPPVGPGTQLSIVRCTAGVEALPAPLTPGATAAFAQLTEIDAPVQAFSGVFTGPKVAGGALHVAFNKSAPDKYQTATIPLDPTALGDLTITAHHPGGTLTTTYTGTP